jgi:hypothetical protein
LKRLCAATPQTPEAFVRHVQQLIRQYPPERILNIDETNSESISPGLWTWATMESQSASCLIENDEKQGMRVIASVDDTRAKRPFTIIGQGQTLRSRSVLNLPPELWTAISQSGWTTSEMMCRYFRLKAYAWELSRTLYHTTYGAKTMRQMMAQNLLVVWERVGSELIESAWDFFQDAWANNNSDDPGFRIDNAEFHPHMTRDDFADLE